MRRCRGSEKTRERRNPHPECGSSFPISYEQRSLRGKTKRRGGGNLKLKATAEETIHSESEKLSSTPHPSQHGMSLTLRAPVHGLARITWVTYAAMGIPMPSGSCLLHEPPWGPTEQRRPRGVSAQQGSRLSPGPESVCPGPSSDTEISQRGWSCFKERLGS